jgi:hypothetical protein
MTSTQTAPTQDLDHVNTDTVHRAYRVIDVVAPVSAPYRARRARTVSALVSQSLDLFPGLRDAATVPARLFLVLVGFLPVTLIAASTFGVVGLRDLARFVLVPAIIATTLVMYRNPWARRLVLRSMLVGAIATVGYDLIRFGFIWSGLMHHDPIPHIGTDLHLSPAWVFGYLWRYCCNGAGLSLAFFSLGFSRVRQGLLFGLFVATGLIFLIAVSPYAAQVLWSLNAISVTMIVSGHLAFGAGLVTVRSFLTAPTARSAIVRTPAP